MSTRQVDWCSALEHPNLVSLQMGSIGGRKRWSRQQTTPDEVDEEMRCWENQ